MVVLGGKNSILGITSIFASVHPVAFFMKNILAGVDNSGIWPFSVNAFSDKDFRVASALCGGSNEPCVLKAE
jgi:hypothetical protein